MAPTTLPSLAATLALVASAALVVDPAAAYTPQSQGRTITSVSSSTVGSSRRAFLSTITAAVPAAAIASVLTASPTPAFAAAGAAASKDSLLADLRTSKSKLAPIPQMLLDAQWDGVRTILKTPPVNQLWNLGDSQNTLIKLAKETGDMELIEMKDEIAISLQMCDQYTYDNAFVYFQPGDGKTKLKEPTEMAQRAVKQIQDAIDFVTAE